MMSTLPGLGVSENTGCRPPSCARRRREDLQVVGGRAGALRDARDRGALRGIARLRGGVDQPVGQHAAAFAAERGDQDGDRLRVTRSHSIMVRRMRCAASGSTPVRVWITSAR